MNMRTTELKDTAQLMSSANYKERFQAEYLQTKLRYDKLHRMCVKYEAGTLEFEPACSLDLLKQQKRAMGEYLHCLEIRAQIEKIDLGSGGVSLSESRFEPAGGLLSGFAVGDLCKLGEHEMIILEHFADGTTALLRKDALRVMAFGKDNNYNGSDVDRVCNEFADELAAIAGEENLVLHEVDLTADDGLKGLGKIQRRASVRTAAMQRKYVEVLDKYRLDIWEWLATAFSIPPHDNDNWVKCVSPSGYFSGGNCNYFDHGVRPFCILKSNIFVSK